jgi:hypothetical protein
VDGDFVIAWESQDLNGLNRGVYAQRYDVSGQPQGDEIRVHTTVPGSVSSDSDRRPSVAMDADGDFLVAWDSLGQDGSSWGVFAQRFAAAGVRQGVEFRVNTTTAGHQARPSVAMDAVGNAVISWEGEEGNDGGLGIYAQRYTATGQPLGGEFRVDENTGGGILPSVDMNAAGHFVVVWNSDVVYARRYRPDGQPEGAPFGVSPLADDGQVSDSVAIDADGDFVVTWAHESVQEYCEPGMGCYFERHTAVLARRYNASGAPQGSAIIIDTGHFDSRQLTPGASWVGFSSVAIGPDGDFVVAWYHFDNRDSSTGVYAQRFGRRPPRVDQVFLNGTAWEPAFKEVLRAQGLGHTVYGYAVPTGAGQFDVLPWNNINQISIRFGEHVLAADLRLSTASLTGVDLPVSGFVYDDATHTVTWTLAQPLRAGTVLLGINGSENQQKNDATGDFLFAVNVLPGDANRNGFVSPADFGSVRAAVGRSTADPGTEPRHYTIFRDVNGSGAVSPADLGVVRGGMGTAIPLSPPPARAALAVGVPPPERSATRDLFGGSAVLG